MYQLSMVYTLLFGTCLLCGVIYGQEQYNCSTPVYLEIGKEGRVRCSYQDYTIISWHTRDGVESNGASLVNFDNIQRRGSGYLSGKFGIDADGSLIFRNTSLDDDGWYVITVAQDNLGKEWKQEVEVIVAVPPEPNHPLVDNIHKQRIFMEVDRNGTITCSLIRVRPMVSLTWTVLDSGKKDLITFHQISTRSTHNDDDDETFDVSLTSEYYVEDVNIKRLTIQCGVDGAVGETLTAKTRVDLLFTSEYPVVNGYLDQRHVFLDVEREGFLTCWKKDVDASTTLSWHVIDSTMRHKIEFDDNPATLDNNYGAVNINKTVHYRVEDNSLDRITIECKVIEHDTGDVFATLVELLFPHVYPVVNGHVNQKHVYLDVDREGLLNCLKENVEVGSTLLWEVVDPSMHDKITFQSKAVISNINDGTININQTFDYEVQDHSLDRITIECKLTEPNTDEHPLVTTVDLLFQNVYPVVNGHVNQKHVYLDVDREGLLNCLKENVEVGSTLLWEVVDPSMHDKITFQSNEVISNNIDGTININQTFDYEVQDHSLDRITIECKLTEPNTDEHPLVTTVDLLFQSVYPVVNGHVNQKHVYLDANREGHLTCLKENVDAGTILVWEVIDPHMYDKITFQSNAVISHNSDGTISINQTFEYEVHDHSLDRITIECKVMEPDTDEHPFTTKVDLLLQKVYPVVNGHGNQKHVYLDVHREGHLTCLKENVDVGTTLAWVLPPSIHHKVNFQSNAVISNNNDGTININQTFDYQVLDNTLERVTVECKVMEPDTDEHPYTTTVELLFSSDPVISGCYHNHQNCVLEVEREGELTCTVKSSHYPVNLKWTMSDRDITYLAFEEDRVTSQNHTNLYDVSITTPYTVTDEAVTTVTVQCDAVKSDSGHVLATAKTSLVIQSGDMNKSSHGAVLGIGLSTMFLVIVVVLIVSFLLYFNRKLYKKSEMKYQECLWCRPDGNGYHIPEVPIVRNGHNSAGGLLVMHASEDCALNKPQSSERDKSSDSGNAGSNSREWSEKEASEKSGMLEDIEMFSNINMQASWEGKGRNSKQEPMV